MTKSTQIANNDQTTSVSQPAKRAWVTPAFEQMPLKEALNTFEPSIANDGNVNSS